MNPTFITSSPLFHLFFPHHCVGCGSDLISSDNFLCLQCINNLPHTGFGMHANNPVEKIFWGRISLVAAMSEFYFSKASIIQNLVHEFKYHGNRKLAHYLGNFMGKSLEGSNRFKKIDALVPLPLSEKKEKQRGYNQAEFICNGIAEIIGLSVIKKNVIRTVHTETQTKKGRIQRWKNVEETFSVLHPEELEGKHILLVDDVITTGATLESCGTEILKIRNTCLSVATLSYAT